MDDPIWMEISDFGLPWPPFKYNSGMGTVGVDWTECLHLSLVQEGEPTAPPSPPSPKLFPDFERFLIRTLSEINSMSLPQS
jgi:hypothetical protein